MKSHVSSPDAAPDGFPHVNKTPVKVGPYTISSGHIIFPLLHEIMMGHDSWTNTTKFDPTRFIEDGKYQQDERVIPFQIGKRMEATLRSSSKVL